MHLFVRSIAILALSAATVACADAPNQPRPPIDQQLSGTWLQDQFCGADPPCAGVPELTIAATNSVIDGYLRWPVGNDSVAVTGFFSGRSVEFDIAPLFGVQQHFRGWLDFSGRLSGELSVPPATSGFRVAYSKAE